MTTTPVHSITDEQIAEIEDDGCYATAAEFNAIIARLRKAEKDAARYQWLVKHSTYGIDSRQRPELTLSIYAPDHRDGLSAAIDAAMGQGGSDE